MRPEHAVAARGSRRQADPGTSGTLPLTLAMLRRREVPSRSTAPVLRLQCGPASPDHVRDRLLEGSLRSAPQDDDGGGLRARAVRPRSGVGHHAGSKSGPDPKSLPSGLTRGGAGCRFSGLLVERYVRLGAQVPPDIPRRSFRLPPGHPERVGRRERPKPRLPEPRPRDLPSSPPTVPGVDRRSLAGDECRVYRNKSCVCQPLRHGRPRA
jgi:hypothetical protein